MCFASRLPEVEEEAEAPARKIAVVSVEEVVEAAGAQRPPGSPVG